MKTWTWMLIVAWLLFLPDVAQAGPDDPERGAATVTEEDTEKNDADDKDESAKTTDAEDEEEEDESKEKKSKKSRIPQLAELKIDEYVVSARALNLPLPGKTRTLQDLLDRLEELADDEDVGGVFLDLGPVALSIPDVEELRGAIQRTKDKDKKIFAYLNGGGANAYLLACTADEIAMAPSGGLEISGIGRLFPFMKGYYQMLGTEYDVITAGKYKYPGFLNRREPDKYFSEEFNAILDSWFDDYVEMIAKCREMKPAKVREAIDTAIFNPTAAQRMGLVDKLAYRDEFRDRLLQREKLKRDRSQDRDLSKVNSIQDLVQAINDELQKAAEARKAVGPKIAVLHARGPIVDMNLGAGFASQLICRDDFAKVVDDLRKNKSIKAVVMRVDSPGGSGYASDVIWRRLRQLDEVKPLVVSMGTVAGSGGYYIACPARRIFAQPTTLTGSIGVLGILSSSRSMFNRRDYELTEMKRGERSLLGAPHKALSPKDRGFIQEYMDQFYDIFIDRVASTRKRPEVEVREIAQGRIWSGRDALENGLIDELGGLADAIESARRMANIPESAELKIVHYPRPGSLGEIFGSLSPLTSTQAINSYLQGPEPAQRVTFDQQLSIFSQRFTPLCWMGVPDLLYQPNPAELLGPLLPKNGPPLFWQEGR